MINADEKEEVICIESSNGKTGHKGRKVYEFLVDGMLIDTGFKQIESDLIPFYENHSIDLVTLTHSHEDHSGTASWFQDNRNVPIFVHEKGISICAEQCPYPQYFVAMLGIYTGRKKSVKTKAKLSRESL